MFYLEHLLWVGTILLKIHFPKTLHKSFSPFAADGKREDLALEETLNGETTELQIINPGTTQLLCGQLETGLCGPFHTGKYKNTQALSEFILPALNTRSTFHPQDRQLSTQILTYGCKRERIFGMPKEGGGLSGLEELKLLMFHLHNI